jgi:hypothetical protein
MSETTTGATWCGWWRRGRGRWVKACDGVDYRTARDRLNAVHAPDKYVAPMGVDPNRRTDRERSEQR